MPRRASRPTVLKLSGPVVLEWENGQRILLSPASPAQPAGPTAGIKQQGRPAGPATQAVIAAMKADGSKPRSRAAYMAVLREAGHKGSAASAGLIVAREAKRVFGRPLGRDRTLESRPGRSPGRQPSPSTLALRRKIAEDKAGGHLREPGHYVRWLVDQPGVKLGLKQARPLVYRELRAVTKA